MAERIAVQKPIKPPWWTFILILRKKVYQSVANKCSECIKIFRTDRTFSSSSDSWKGKEGKRNSQNFFFDLNLCGLLLRSQVTRRALWQSHPVLFSFMFTWNHPWAIFRYVSPPLQNVSQYKTDEFLKDKASSGISLFGYWSASCFHQLWQVGAPVAADTQTLDNLWYKLEDCTMWTW